jgi:hypothetical protein
MPSQRQVLLLREARRKRRRKMWVEPELRLALICRGFLKCLKGLKGRGGKLFVCFNQLIVRKVKSRKQLMSAASRGRDNLKLGRSQKRTENSENPANRAHQRLRHLIKRNLGFQLLTLLKRRSEVKVNVNRAQSILMSEQKKFFAIKNS